MNIRDQLHKKLKRNDVIVDMKEKSSSLRKLLINMYSARHILNRSGDHRNCVRGQDQNMNEMQKACKVQNIPFEILS